MITAPFVGAHSAPSPALRPECRSPYKVPTAALGGCYNPTSQMRKWRPREQTRLAQTTQLEGVGQGPKPRFPGTSSFQCTHCFPSESPALVAQGAAGRGSCSFRLWRGHRGHCRPCLPRRVAGGDCPIFHWSRDHNMWASRPAADLSVPGSPVGGLQGARGARLLVCSYLPPKCWHTPPRTSSSLRPNLAAARAQGQEVVGSGPLCMSCPGSQH